MQTLNDNQNTSSDYPVWFFLAGFSLGDFLLDHDRRDKRTVGLLFQAVQELGISREWVENIEVTLAEFAKDALVHFKLEGKIPGRVCVFCQKKIIDDANFARAITGCYPPGNSIDEAQKILVPGTKMSGGWGYFLIERGGNVAPGSSESAGNSVDLYLYKEGE